jgi:hypothetical protein
MSPLNSIEGRVSTLVFKNLSLFFPTFENPREIGQFQRLEGLRGLHLEEFRDSPRVSIQTP